MIGTIRKNQHNMSDDRGVDLIRVAKGEGSRFAVAGADLTWKIRGQQTDGKFCMFEQVLEPGTGVPLHTHSYSEAFYVLSGTIEFASEGGVWQCAAGDVVIAPAQAKHTFHNRGDETARLLSISVVGHERFFDAVEQADRAEPFSALAPEAAMARVVAIGSETDTNFVLGEKAR
ncbi:cupin domain-containing protein [Sphingomonas sp. NFR15]|uniref:cupin domain-containing protein n=1 Tax=Sphingomonas sp. NFR15 TaxID=1566282 RepID=UPI0008902260|nr:cupin domain-containing protein [Sphingomonas sp. NFR15]SDA24652.1 Cupin domain-containing protein [Sphingomonas sp. NFR15]